MDAPRKDGGRCEGRTEELHLKVLENGHEIEVDIQDTNLSLKKYNDSGKDSPWSWVVTAATFVMHFIFYGFTYVIGIYFVSLLEAFHMGSTMTSFIGSIYIGCICCTGPVAGILINKCGCRVTLFVGTIISSLGQLSSSFAQHFYALFFTMGVLTGFGHGLILMAAIVSLNMYFDRYRVLGFGISLVGTAAGNIAYPYITRFLINLYGWRGALLISCGINLQMCVAAMLVRPLPVKKQSKSSKMDQQSKEIPQVKKTSYVQTTLKLFKDIHVWLLMLNNVLFVFGIVIFVTHIIAFCLWTGLSESQADMILSLLGVSALLGRIITAMIAQHRRVKPYLMLFLCLCYVLAGVAMLSYGSSRTFAGLLLSVLIYGFLSATNGSVSAEYASQVIDEDSFALGYGYVMLINAFGAVGGAPTAGFLYDKTKFYPASMYLAGACMILSGLAPVPTHFARRNKLRNKARTLTVSYDEVKTTH